MARPEKVSVVDEIAEKIEQTRSLFLTDFTGLDVEAINELRRLLRENSVEYRVVKNTLARLAAEKAGREDLKPYLVGPTAMAFGFEDPVMPAKLISRFAQKTGKPAVKAILFEEQLLGMEALDRIKNLSSREELLSQVVSGLKAPLATVIMILAGLLRGFMGLLEAIARAKGEDEGRGKEASVEEKVDKKEELEAKAHTEEATEPAVEEKVEEQAEAQAQEEAEAELEGTVDQRAEKEMKGKAEQKAESKAEARTEDRAEKVPREEQAPIKETQPKPAEKESSQGEDKDDEMKTIDSQQAQEKQPSEKEPENKGQEKG